MARSTPPLDPALVDRLTTFGADAPSLAEKTAILRALREHASGDPQPVDRLLLDYLDTFATRLDKARAVHAELRDILDRLRATPWHPAVFLRTVDTTLGRRAMVFAGGGERLVGVDLDVDLDTLQTGDDIYLNQDQTNIMAAAGPLRRAIGETGYFDRWLCDDRLIVKWRDDEVVVDAVGALREASLTPGDRLRWNRTVGIAYERLDHDPGTRYLLGDVPDASLAMLGGQAKSIETLLTALTATLVDATKAAAYGLNARQTVLLVGPNGVGKTLMVRIAAAEISRRGGRPCRVFVVKPAEFEAPYVGEAQANIRQCFQALHRAAEEGPTLLFLDEVEAIGRVRGHASGYHSDKFLAALLAEMDGFSGRGNVAIVAATNRKPLLDPAFLATAPVRSSRSICRPHCRSQTVMAAALC
jgi:proteasome-associated ATPase